jgi:hypothetical protein
MDVPPKTQAATADETVVAANAYELFWDSFENDTAADDPPSVDAHAADAYGLFWAVSDL